MKELSHLRKAVAAAGVAGISLATLIAVILLEATLLKGLLAVSAFTLTVITWYTWWVEHARPALNNYLNDEEEVIDAEGQQIEIGGVRPPTRSEDVKPKLRSVDDDDERAA